MDEHTIGFGLLMGFVDSKENIKQCQPFKEHTNQQWLISAISSGSDIISDLW